MRILQINNQHYVLGGAHRVYFNTSKLLEEQGHQVFFFSMQEEKMFSYEYSSYFPKAIDYRKLSFFSKLKATKDFIYNKDVYNKLLDYIDLTKPDIAHVHLFMGGLTTSILYALKKRNIPVVHSVHDYRLICPDYLLIDGQNKICEQCKDKFYLRCAIKRCSENNLTQSAMLAFDAYFRKYIASPVENIDRFIFSSQFIKAKHIEFNSDYEPKAEVLFNFVPDLNSVVSSNVKGKYFLYYGRLSREKGVNTLVEAALKAGIPLKIVGIGPLLEQYKTHKFDNIEFVGFKKGEELWDLVRRASFVIVPSEWYENNPLTIIESYSHGKPVIGANIGGITELIEEGKTGFLSESGNMEELSGILQKADKIDDHEYALFSKNAKQFAENKFNPTILYQELVNIYNKCINYYSKK